MARPKNKKQAVQQYVEAKMPVQPKKTSYARKYTEVVADRVLEMLSTGKTLRYICSFDGMPTPDLVIYWATHPDEDHRPGFPARYLEARKIGLLLMGEEILDLADDSSADIKERMALDANGNQITIISDNPINIQRTKLQIETRKWILSKLMPEVYGDKLEVNHNISEDLAKRIDAARARYQQISERPHTGQLEGMVEVIEDACDALEKG